MKKGETLTLRIEDLAFGGKGIARVDGYPIFVSNTIPGQEVQVRLAKKRKSHGEGRLIRILSPSAEEQSIPYQSIPGAPYATWPIKLQEENKLKNSLELYKRLGHFKEVETIFDTFIPSPIHWHYRNKMEYTFSPVTQAKGDPTYIDDFSLGFKHRGQWLSVENLEKDSGLFDAEVENALSQVRNYCQETGLQSWHPKRHTGFFRNLVVRRSLSTNALLVNLITTSHGLDSFDIEAFGAFIQELWNGRIEGFQHTLNDHTGDRNSRDADLLVKQVIGKETIEEQLLGLTFEMSIESFFQPNPKAAELLYQKAIDYVFEGDIPEGSLILDLFCGTGTIGQLIAHQNKEKFGKRVEIIGVDIVEEAIENAAANAEKNKIEGLRFHAADVGKFLLEYPEYKGKIHTIVLDPPRSGITPKSLQRIIALDAPRIVYVSCNPATQARDQEELRKAGYTFKKLSFVDQFPHTAHVEAIGVFEK